MLAADLYSVKERRMIINKFNLQYFAEGDGDGDGDGDAGGGDADFNINSMADLDSLLDGKDDKSKTNDDEDDDDEDKKGDDQDADGDDDSDTDDSDDDSDDDQDDKSGDDEDDSDDDAGDDDDDPEKKDDPAKKQTKTDSKDNKAFAAMRAENSTLKKQMSGMEATLKQIALGLGLDGEDKDLLGTLNDVALKGRAKREKRTPEDIQKDAELNQYKAKEFKDHTYNEIGQIKSELGATDEEIRAFVSDVMKQGLDPFTSKIELKAKYISANYEKIVKKATDEAVEKALKRDKSADKNSGKSKKNGKKGSGTHKIETMAELDKYIDSL